MHLEEEDLYNKDSFFPNDNFLRSSLFNEELSGRMTFYYGKVDGRDSHSRGHLFFCRNRRLGERLDRLSLGNILTTGLPKEDVDRYYSSYISFYGLFESGEPP